MTSKLNQIEKINRELIKSFDNKNKQIKELPFIVQKDVEE